MDRITKIDNHNFLTNENENDKFSLDRQKNHRTH